MQKYDSLLAVNANYCTAISIFDAVAGARTNKLHHDLTQF